MPELPEVETVRRGLMTYLPGKLIKSVSVFRERTVGYPDVSGFSQKLCGHRFVDTQRRGKYLLLTLDKGAVLCVHLGMSGRLLIAKSKAPVGQHVRALIQIDDGCDLRFDDPRVFGHLWYIPKGKRPEQIISGLAQMGVEPFDDLSATYLQQAFKQRKQAIKGLLLNQQVIAGIGNIYADESLFKAGINPLRSVRSLSYLELEILTENIKQVLNHAIDLGGSTLRNYTDSRGVNGNYQEESLVYGRTGKPCHSCGESIRRVVIAGRSSHFCPQCQPDTKGKKLRRKR